MLFTWEFRIAVVPAVFRVAVLGQDCAEKFYVLANIDGFILFPNSICLRWAANYVYRKDNITILKGHCPG